MYKTDTKLFDVVEAPNLSQKKTPMREQPLEKRRRSFDEIALGYTPEEAMEEAARCLGCPGHYCQQDCPAHVPVPEFIAAVRAGEFERAYRIISQANNLPAFTGRICAQERQCESNCTRGIKCESTGIGRLERFVADWHYAHAEAVSAVAGNGARVVVVGSGPAGLACAEDLARAGCTVTVREAAPFLGGVPAYGIPAFVLPRRVIEQKLEEMKGLGVKFEVNAQARDLTALLAEGYRAVFLATGAGIGVKAGLTGEDLPGVYSANEYLRRANQEAEPIAGKIVAVIGGGNTAVDVCRTAVRIGAERVILVYRRGRGEMPARSEEVEQALAEGVELYLFTQPVEFLGDSQLKALRCLRTELSAPDYPMGRRNVTAVAGSEFELATDVAVLALGYAVEAFPGVKTAQNGRIAVSKTMATSLPGVYAGGDCVNGAATLVEAMAAGKRAAAAILAEL